MAEIKQEYGGALYLLAQEDGVAPEIGEQLTALNYLFQKEPDYYRLMKTPTVTMEEKLSAIDEALTGQVHVYIINFIKILIENGYFDSFNDCCNEFTDRFNRDRNICIATVTSAARLNRDQTDRLKTKLEKITGKVVTLICTVDAAVIGGIRVEVDGMLFDGTVRNKIETLDNNLQQLVI